MKKFYVDFDGYCIIEAETAEEAEQKFWHNLPTIGTDDVWNLYDIEEKTDLQVVGTE